MGIKRVLSWSTFVLNIIAVGVTFAKATCGHSQDLSCPRTSVDSLAKDLLGVVRAWQAQFSLVAKKKEDEEARRADLERNNAGAAAVTPPVASTSSTDSGMGSPNQRSRIRTDYGLLLRLLFSPFHSSFDSINVSIH